MTVQITVPDIGDFADVEVIELLVAEGDTLEVEQGIVTVESDKASMELPADQAGKVLRVLVKVGDKINKGTALVEIEPAEASKGGQGDTPEAADKAEPATSKQPQPAEAAPAPQAATGSGEQRSASGSEGAPRAPAPAGSYTSNVDQE